MILLCSLEHVTGQRKDNRDLLVCGDRCGTVSSWTVALSRAIKSSGEVSAMREKG